MHSLNRSNSNNQTDAFMVSLAFVCQGFLWEYIFTLLKRHPYLFSFFFFDQLGAFYNFECLLSYNSYSTSYMRSSVVGVSWKRTRRPWGKIISVYKVERAKHFFLGLAVSAVALEVYLYKGIPWLIFGSDFFYEPPKKKVYYLMNRFWWFSVDMFIFMKSYVFHLALARYNHYVEGIFGGKKPLLRGATIWKVRSSLAPRYRVRGMDFFISESYEIFLFFSRFVFYIERGHTFEYKYPKRKLRGLSIENEDLVAEVCEEWPGNHNVSTVFGGLYSRHIFSLFLPVSFFGSSDFWKFTSFYFLYFVHSFIQKSPKKFTFTKSWVSWWLSLPMIGSMWRTLKREFIERFWRAFMEKYLVLLVTGKNYVNSSLLEVLLSSGLAARRWFALVPSHLYDINFLDYGREYWINANVDFAVSFSQWATVWRHWRTADMELIVPTKNLTVQDLIPGYRRAWDGMQEMVWGFIIEHFCSFTNIRDMLPCSYGIFIFWKSNSMFFFTRRLSKVNNLISYFKRLNLDDFFFSRLSVFFEFFHRQLFLLRALASWGPAVADTFIAEGKKLSLIFGKGFFEANFFEDSSVGVFGMPAFLKMRMLFYFHLRDLIFKNLCWSKVLPFYLFLFNVFYCSIKLRRLFAFALERKQGWDFKVYLLNRFSHNYAPPVGQEPINFYDSRHSASILKRFFFFDVITRPYLAVKSAGWRRGIKWAKWHALFSALDGTGVSISFCLEMPVDESNWELSYRGDPIPLPWLDESLEKKIKVGLLEMRWSFYYMIFGK